MGQEASKNSQFSGNKPLNHRFRASDSRGIAAFAYDSCLTFSRLEDEHKEGKATVI